MLKMQLDQMPCMRVLRPLLLLKSLTQLPQEPIPKPTVGINTARYKECLILQTIIWKCFANLLPIYNPVLRAVAIQFPIAVQWRVYFGLLTKNPNGKCLLLLAQKVVLPLVEMISPKSCQPKQNP